MFQYNQFSKSVLFTSLNLISRSKTLVSRNSVFPSIPKTFVSNISTYGSKAADRLAGKTVLLTGASSGIGQATALELAAAANGNLKLIISARRSDRLQKLKSSLESKYPSIKVLPLPLDVSNYHTIPKFVTDLPKDFADIDILINNAGLVKGLENVGDVSQSDIETMFNTNVLGLITLTQAILPILKKKNSGDILNIGSIAGKDPYPGGSIYCATKAAVLSFTHSLRKETIDTQIRILQVDPGAVETEFSLVRFRGDQGKADNVYKGMEPLVAEDIAEIITFALTRRQNVVMAETLVFPTNQASAFHVYKK